MPQQEAPEFRERLTTILDSAKKLEPGLEDADYLAKAMDDLRTAFNSRLLRQIETGDPYSDWTDYSHGDVLFETKRPRDDQDWHLTKSGLVLMNLGSPHNYESYNTADGSLKTTLIPFGRHDLTAHPEGMMHSEGESLILNDGERVLYQKQAIPDGIFQFHYHPWGFVVIHGSEVWLNGNILLTDQLSEEEHYKENEGGIIVRRNMGNVYEFYQNNRHFLAADEGQRNDLWLATGVGVVTSQNTEGNGVDYYLNEEHLVHRERHEPMKPHSHGVVFVENGERSTRLVLNGTRTLYEGKLAGFKSYKDGVVVHRKKPSTRSTYEFVFQKSEKS